MGGAISREEKGAKLGLLRRWLVYSYEDFVRSLRLYIKLGKRTVASFFLPFGLVSKRSRPMQPAMLASAIGMRYMANEQAAQSGEEKAAGRWKIERRDIATHPV